MNKRILIAALLALSSIAFGATTVPVQLLNPTGSTAGQAIVSTGASTAPAWGGVGLNGLAAQAANTVVANATGSSAAPTAIAMPSCSTAGTALQWTNGTGFICTSGYASSGGVGAFTALSASGNDALNYVNTSSQSIPNNAFTTITGWTKVFDRVNANFNASTGTFTAPIGGIYAVKAGVTYSAHAGTLNNQYELTVVGTGTNNGCIASTFRSVTSTMGIGLVTGCDISLTAGQAIIIQTFQNSGAAVTLLNNGSSTWVSIHRVP